MSLLPEQQKELAEYIRVTKGTPYAPYNPPTTSHFTRAVGLVTLFPLIGAILPVAVDNGIIKMAAIAMLIICPLLGIPALLLSVGADKAHARDDDEESAKKAGLARVLGLAGITLGTVVTVVGISVAFFAFVVGEDGHSKAAEPGEASMPTEMAAEADATAPGADATAPGADATAPGADAEGKPAAGATEKAETKKPGK